MRIVILNSIRPRRGQSASVHEIDLDIRVHGVQPSRNIDLAVVDASKMTPTAVSEALAWIQETHKREPSARIAMVWPNPPIDVVVKALRSGVNDFIKEPLSVSRLHRILLKCGTPSAAPKAARALISCGVLLEQVTFTEEEADLANVLMRERKLHHREAALAAETKRLEGLREVLQHRENELRLRAMRLDEEFMQLQNDSDLHLGSSVGSPARFAGYEARRGPLTTRVGLTGPTSTDIESRERLLSDSSDGG